VTRHELTLVADTAGRVRAVVPPLTPDQQDAQDETDLYRRRGGRAR
jgi:hypothetical protein